MYQEERQKKILKYVNENKKISVKELSELLDTSVVTIRSDISKLQDKGLLIRSHGGVMANSYKIDDVIPSDVKFQKHKNEKKKIAAMATTFIEDGDIIIIDSGSTTLELAKKITQKNLTVFTNDLQIAIELSKRKNIKLIVSGGILISGVYTLTGSEAVNLFKNIHAKKLFISCDAYDKDFGISNRDTREVEIKKAMLQAVDKKYLLIDSSKLNQKVMAKVADIDTFDYFICDEISNELREIIETSGVTVVTE